MDQLYREGISLPVVGIGGIGREDAAVLLEAGLYGIAFSGLLLKAEDREELVRSLELEIKNTLLC
jgi:thiamine-phosphate pyrophosphorylase